MKFVIHPHRFADVIVGTPEFSPGWQEVVSVLNGLDELEVARLHESYDSRPKSLSYALNELLAKRFKALGWTPEAEIFGKGSGYDEGTWRLDFAKHPFSVEVGFNHGEAVAWNLIKPSLASDLNHVQKAIQTEVGIVIAATEGMKAAGGFDSAVGTFEKYCDYLTPLRHMLTIPMMIIGIDPPETYRIEHRSQQKRMRGYIVRI